MTDVSLVQVGSLPNTAFVEMLVGQWFIDTLNPDTIRVKISSKSYMNIVGPRTVQCGTAYVWSDNFPGTQPSLVLVAKATVTVSY